MTFKQLRNDVCKYHHIMYDFYTDQWTNECKLTKKECSETECPFWDMEVEE